MNMNENKTNEIIIKILESVQSIGQENSFKKIKKDFSLSDEDFENYLRAMIQSGLLRNKNLISRELNSTGKVVDTCYVITQDGKEWFLDNQ